MITAVMNVSRIASLVLATAYACLVLSNRLPLLSTYASLRLVFVALVLIWFPEAIGRFLHDIGPRTVGGFEPSWIVATCGWVLLIGAPIAEYLIKSSFPELRPH